MNCFNITDLKKIQYFVKHSIGTYSLSGNWHSPSAISGHAKETMLCMCTPRGCCWRCLLLPELQTNVFRKAPPDVWPQNGKCSHTILTHLKPGLRGRTSWVIILPRYFLNTLIIPRVKMKIDKWLEQRMLKSLYQIHMDTFALYH
jgi:hypothetical protein